MTWKPKFTQEEEMVCVQLYTEKGMSSPEIAKRIGRSYQGVVDALRRNGIEIKPPGSFSRNFTNEEEAKIAKLYADGVSAKKIAEMYGLNHHISVVDAIKRQGGELRDASARNQVYSINHAVFDRIDNERAAYWLGFIYADGFVNRNSLTVALKKSDDEHIRKLSDFLEYSGPIFYKFGNSKKKKYPNVMVRYTHIHLAQRLASLGIQTGRPCSRQCLDEIPQDLRHHWIRGLFDGDGSARKSRSIVFCGDYELMEVVRGEIALGANTNPELAITKHKTANLYYIYYSGRHVVARVAEYLYGKATVWLDRKQKVVESWK